MQKTTIKQLVEVINIFNCELKTQSKEKGFGLLDIHRLTNKGDGFSNDFLGISIIYISLLEGMLEVCEIRVGSVIMIM